MRSARRRVKAKSESANPFRRFVDVFDESSPLSSRRFGLAHGRDDLPALQRMFDYWPGELRRRDIPAPPPVNSEQLKAAELAIKRRIYRDAGGVFGLRPRSNGVLSDDPITATEVSNRVHSRMAEVEEKTKQLRDQLNRHADKVMAALNKHNPILNEMRHIPVFSLNAEHMRGSDAADALAYAHGNRNNGISFWSGFDLAREDMVTFGTGAVMIDFEDME